MIAGYWMRKAVLVAELMALCIVGARSAEGGSTSKVVVSGTLDVLQEDDFQHGKTRRIHRLVADDGQGTFLLHFSHDPQRDLLTGMKIRVRGDQALGDASISVDPDASGTVVLQEAALVSTVTRRAVVLLVDFTGDSTGAGAGTVSCSVAQTSDLFYTRARTSGGNFDESYGATSYNQMAWDPNVDGINGADVFRVQIVASVVDSCSYTTNTWANLADAAVTAGGVDLTPYQHRIYVLPNTTNCSWAGLANLGCGTWCRSFIKGSSCNTLDVFTHELGHNLGMAHASTDTNNDGVVDSSCSYWGTSYSGGEYCDRSDFMGIGGDGKRQNNGPHKLQMGWVSSAKLVDAGSGSFTIAPLGTDPALTSLPQLLRVPRAAGAPYYVSYRTNADPYEDNLRADYQQKTSIHTYAGGTAHTLFVIALADGQAFTDTVSGISISQVSHTATSADIQVSTSIVCTPGAPTVALSPTVQAGRAGDTRTYSVLVTNRDSNACPSSTFSLAAAVPSGWAASLSSSTMTLGPGQQGSGNLSVTSPLTSVDGSSPVSATATSTLSGSGSGSYCIDSIGPNPVSNLVAAIKQKTRVQLTWSMPSVTGCAPVASFAIYRDGVLLTTTSNTSYLDGSTVSGRTYSYAVIARDSLGNSSPSGNTVSVTISGGGRR